MVNLTNPNSYPPGGRTWAVAFIGTAGDLPLLVADGTGLLPEPSPVSRTLASSDGYNLPDEDTTAYWPTDSATITVWEAHRFVLLKMYTPVPPRALPMVVKCFMLHRMRNSSFPPLCVRFLQRRVSRSGPDAAWGWQCLRHRRSRV